MFNLFNRRKRLNRYFRRIDFAYIDIYTSQNNDESEEDLFNSLENAKFIARLYNRKEEISVLRKIVSRRVRMRDGIYSLCLPIYRDALVFYDGNKKKTGVIYICFECLTIINEKGKTFEADLKLFKDIGNYLLEKDENATNNA